MKNLSIIQAVIFGIAAIAILFAVFMFAFYRGGNGNVQFSETTIWGVLPANYIEQTISNIQRENRSNFLSHVVYVEKDPETFDNELLRAVAEGRGPDLVILRENQIVENEKRLTKIPYDSISVGDFKDTYIEESDLLLTEEGLLGIPLMINPLIMYYNRDILNAEGIANPPQTWTEVLSFTPSLSISDTLFNISRSSISLGDYGNINSAKEILWALIMQAGNDVVIRDSAAVREEDGSPYFSILDEKLNFSLPPAYAALRFYTQFTNPGSTIYSWNRSLANSQNLFLAGDLAMYLGFADEATTLRRKNPNLNFDVSVLPQSKKTEDGGKKVTYGQLHFLAISRSVKDLQSAYGTAKLMSGKEFQQELQKISGLPSVRRDLLNTDQPKNSFDDVFRRSALISRGVMEPGASIADDIVKRMIERVISGEDDVEDAVNSADARLNKALTEQ